MANGDPVLRDFQKCTYIMDTGENYGRKVPSFYVSQAALGWDTNSDPTEKSMPRGVKPRTWLLWNAADHTQRSRVVVATNADYIAGVVGTTTIKVAYRGYELTMTLYGMEGERVRGQITDTAVQASLPA